MSIAITVDTLDLPFVIGHRCEASECGCCIGGAWRNRHPIISTVEAEVVDIQIILVGAVEVMDGDVALSSIAAQVGGVFHIAIGGSGFTNQSGGEVGN